DYACFHCTQKGHVAKSCPTKLSDERLYAQAGSTTFKHGDEATRARIKMNKDMVVCFKCHEQGHFTNKCPQGTKAIPNHEKPTVSIKYPELIFFKTKGILKGTDMDTWDDFWYSTKPGKYRNKPSQMKFVQRKIKREIEGFGPCARQITKECKAMLRNKIEQINLFNSTLSSNKFRDYACFYCTQKGHVAKSCPKKLSDERLYAQAGSTTFKHRDEATRARIKMNKDMVACFKCHERGHFTNKCPQGTKVIPNHEKPTVSIKYPEFIFFKTKGILKGTDMDTWDDFWYDNGTSKEWDDHRDKFNKVLKWFFNHYLNRSLPGMLPPTIKGVTIHLFDLYKLIECMGGFLHVQFYQKFGALAEILSRSDGEEIQRCYIDYLEVLVSYYKTARSSRDPTRGNEDLECFKGYRCDGNMDDTMAAKKGKGQVEHFGITLEEEGNNKHQYFAHQEINFGTLASEHKAWEVSKQTFTDEIHAKEDKKRNRGIRPLDYACFYCTQKGHVAKSCPTKQSDERLYAQAGSTTFKHRDEATRARIKMNKDMGLRLFLLHSEGPRCEILYAQARSTTFKHGDEATRARIKMNKDMVACFKCHERGHFVNKCPQGTKAIPNHEKPTVSIKYPEFIFFKTKGILKGTDMDTWDDFWYVSSTTNKHMTSNLEFFTNLKEDFSVDFLEEQKKFLFTYGIGEVLISNGDRTYLIPGSTKPRKYRNKPSQMKFVQRKIKREIKGFGPSARQIIKECKAMLRNKIEQINLFNSILSSNKFRDYACFYCPQKGHVAKSCPTKLSDERLYAQAGSTTFKHGDEATRARIKMNKDMVACFKCHERGHFANKCPQDKGMNIKRRIEPICDETKDDGDVHNFQECVASLNLIKQDNGTSKEWKDHRDKFNKVLKWFFNYYLNRSLPGMLPPTIKGVTIHLFVLYKLIECMGGFLHVQFCQKFGVLAEILSRSDGEEIQRCYIDYLEVLVSYYKTARSSRDPTRRNEDLECFKGYRCDGNMDVTMAAKKGKGQAEHFGITLEEEGNNKH
nr:ARID DNA-binding domain-containing protein [Tanacetum cinerariifolium]